MRQKLFTTLGANADYRYMVRWSQEPPHRRTVLVEPDDDGRPTERWSLPWVVFGEVYSGVTLRHRTKKRCQWRFEKLLVYARGKPITATSDTRMIPTCLPNAFSGEVCLGTAARRVRTGSMSAPDAFWNSVFTDDFDYEIIDCLKRGHTQRYLGLAETQQPGVYISEVMDTLVNVSDPWRGLYYDRAL